MYLNSQNIVGCDTHVTTCQLQLVPNRPMSRECRDGLVSDGFWWAPVRAYSWGYDVTPGCNRRP